MTNHPIKQTGFYQLSPRRVVFVVTLLQSEYHIQVRPVSTHKNNELHLAFPMQAKIRRHVSNNEERHEQNKQERECKTNNRDMLLKFHFNVELIARTNRVCRVPCQALHDI